MNPVASSSNPSASTPGKFNLLRLTRAAHQFEAVLLNQLLGSLEHTFSTFGEKKAEAIDHYQFLGLQALASSVAEHGGFGIADMIIRNLSQHQGLGADWLTSPQKSLSEIGSERLDLNF
ncbi:MAG TPA: hypothetical protein VEI26_18540 [Terriglobales bacterium]|nr:hypothetical protein [Terriglobales bacterium]